MLTNVELTFLHIFRKTVIATAGLALVVAACGVLYWAYAEYAPNPAPYADRVSDFRERLTVSELVRAHFPAETRLVKEVDDVFPMPKNYVVLSNWNNPFDNVHQEKMNVFLNELFGVSYRRQGDLERFIFSRRLSFNEDLNDEEAVNEENIWVMYGSLLIAYIDELRTATPKLVELKKSGDYVDSFEKLEGDQYDRALNWFHSEFQAAITEVDQEFTEREVFRLTSSLGLMVAASAFAYFMLVMFFFLAASVEIHIRRISDTLDSTRTPE